MNSVNTTQAEDDVLATTLEPSDVPQRLANGTKRLLGETNPKALIIGTHPMMDYNVGNLLLWNENFKRENRTTVVDTPENVLDHLRLLAHQYYRRFDLALAAYDTHHFNPEQLQDVMALLQMLTHGSAVIMDYAIAGEEHQKVLHMAARKIDRKVLQKTGGPEGWMRSHGVFTQRSFRQAMKGPGWKSAEHFRVSDFGAGFIGSSDFSQAEMSEMVQTALMTREKTVDILAATRGHNHESTAI